MNEKIEIDANPYIMEDCSQAYKDGDVKKARNMQKAFIKAIRKAVKTIALVRRHANTTADVRNAYFCIAPAWIMFRCVSEI